MKLNGWQRLWIVMSGVYVLIVTSLCASEFPTEKEIYQRWQAELILWQKKNDPELTEAAPWDIAKAYSAESPKESIERVQEKYVAQNVFNKFDFEAIAKKYQAELVDLPSMQRQKLKTASLFGLLPVFATYLLGWLAGWVYHGFKSA
jgi:hypothetical protein